MRVHILLVFACFSVFYYSQAQEISDTKFGNGIINYVAKDSSFSIKFAPRIQVRSISSWDYQEDHFGSAEHNFLVRRARLKFEGFAYTPKLKYKIELGLSNRDISGGNDFNRNTPRYILDAVIMWNFYKNFELWAGQTKLPGNVERVVSSANLQLINRSLLNSRFNIDRDAGIQLRHYTQLGESFLMREKLAVSQGEGRNVTEGNQGGLQYTGRIEFLPFGKFASKGDYSQADLKREQTPKLMIGATYDFNNDAVKTRSNLGSYMFLQDGSLYETDITTVFVDAMIKYKGLSFMGEFASRDANKPVALDLDDTPTGDIVLVGNAINAQIGYLFKSNYEVVGRYTTTQFDDVTRTDGEDQYTIGLSKYIVGHKLKVQTDFSYTEVGGEKDNLQFRMGFDLHF